MKKTKTKKDGAIKGSRRNGVAQQVRPEQPEPNSGHSRSYKESKCGLIQRPEEKRYVNAKILETGVVPQINRTKKRRKKTMRSRLNEWISGMVIEERQAAS
ncbi:hypothetical protein Tcan_07452 [Toxocara canis]|uniref:Uncharacterized protein n=1 Tax=Toxocara canis TaxID=6265 RepID=A0A0B2VWH2_TOXCA|nr:hypothetical protein Tcan_07452 [Toxocara canis]